MTRFSPRTLLLMVLALVSYGWFWWRTHQAGPPPKSAPRMQLIVLDDGGIP